MGEIRLLLGVCREKKIYLSGRQMSFLKNFKFFRIFFVASAFASAAYAADRVVGANATLDTEPGARSAALGSATLAVEGDYLGLSTNAYQLSQAKYMWASFSHTAYYEDTKYDYASMVIPLFNNQGLGVSFSRFGADGIPNIKDGEPLPEGSNYRTFSIADWVFSLAWGRRILDRLDLGIAFHVLYRDMDQSGWGFRGDASARYQIKDDFYVAGLLKGWTSSATSWESGEFEYSSPEFYLAMDCRCRTSMASSISIGRVQGFSITIIEIWTSMKIRMEASAFGKIRWTGCPAVVVVSSLLLTLASSCVSVSAVLRRSRA